MTIDPNSREQDAIEPKDDWKADIHWGDVPEPDEVRDSPDLPDPIPDDSSEEMSNYFDNGYNPYGD